MRHMHILLSLLVTTMNFSSTHAWLNMARVLKSCKNIVRRGRLPVTREENDATDPAVAPSNDSRSRPISVQPADARTQLTGFNRQHSVDSVPFGIPFNFESSIFKGKMLIRFRNVDTDDTTGSHEAYFKERRHLMQVVVQGRFKTPINMSDLYVGNVFKTKLSNPPPPSLQRIMNQLFQQLAPGTVLDLSSAKPKILALYGGIAQTMSVDLPGDEPDITSAYLPENMAKIFGSSTAAVKQRKRLLSSPTHASGYMYDTDHIFTFHSSDDALDYSSYSINLPVIGKYHFGYCLGGQPMTISAVLKDGSPMFSFNVWHRDLPVWGTESLPSVGVPSTTQPALIPA
jgi:Protein of unknown function (DUF1769)